MPEKLPEDSRPAWIKHHALSMGQVEFEGEKVPYSILPSTLEPALPNFVGYPDQADLIISDAVPEAYRTHFLRHELWCLGIFAHRHDSCVEALKLELEEVPTEEREAYKTYRTDFYKNLVRLYAQKPESSPKELEILYKAVRGWCHLLLQGE